MNETMIVLVTDQALPACPIIPSISSQGRTLKPSLQPTTSTESFFFFLGGVGGSENFWIYQTYNGCHFTQVA